MHKNLCHTILFIALQISALLLVTGGTEKKIPKTNKGRASYYGDSFNGKRTANGERFDNSDFTAAHRTLPFNSYIRVTNLKNRLSTTVRINDRGPYIRSRIIDLSESAARRIGSYQHGIALVELEQLQLLKLNPIIDSIFRCEDVLDCLGNREHLRGESIRLWKTKDIIHMLYIANELYLEDDVDQVLITGSGFGPERTYSLVVTGFSNQQEAIRAADRFERKGFMKATPVSFR
jgi:rare lipoprotein A